MRSVTPAILCVVLSGCGSDGPVLVEGRVFPDGVPLAGAGVRFVPTRVVSVGGGISVQGHEMQNSRVEDTGAGVPNPHASR